MECDKIGFLTRRAGGVSQFLIFSDKGGGGGKSISDFWLTRGGGGVQTTPFLADIICEQPLRGNYKGFQVFFALSKMAQLSFGLPVLALGGVLRGP